jgi:hypothetical protein
MRGQHVFWEYLSQGGHEHWGELSKGGVVQGRIKVISSRIVKITGHFRHTPSHYHGLARSCPAML